MPAKIIRKKNKLWKTVAEVLHSGDPDRFHTAIDILEAAGIEHQIAYECVLAYWAGGQPRGSVYANQLKRWRKRKEKEEAEDIDHDYEYLEAA